MLQDASDLTGTTPQTQLRNPYEPRTGSASSMASIKFLERLLIEAADEALLELFNGSIMKTVYGHMEESYSLRREDMGERLGEFVKKWRELFGAGHETLEKTIARKLYAKAGWEFCEAPNLTLINYVEGAKKNLVGEGADQQIRIQVQNV